MKRVTVSYFAMLREERGLSEEEVATEAATASEVFGELASRHRFSVSKDRLRVAINDAFAGWETPIRSGDRMALIPPVAGG